MAIRSISRYSVRPGGPAGTDTSAPIYVDKDDNKLKMVPGGWGSTTEVEVIDASTSQTLTNKTFTSPTITTPVIGTSLTAGAGVSSAETYKTSVLKEGGLFTTRIMIDLTGLHGSTTDLDIIGNTGAAAAHWGQIVAAASGTIVGGRVTCLELPVGGADDLDFYSATESTGTEDASVTATLTETVLITSGAAWASGTVKGMTGLPAANEFIYIANGEGGTVGTFSAGKFLIELFGS